MESEANIQTSAEPTAPAMERVTDTPSAPDSTANILGDLRQAFNQPAPQPAPEQAPEATPAPVTEPPPDATPTAPLPEAAAALPAPVEDAAPPAPESHLAPLFSLATLPAEQSLPQAVEMVTNLQSYDPLAHKLLVNSVYQTAPNTFRDWVLGDMGIEPAKVDQFMGWLKNGGPQAPQLGAFPEPDADGYVTLQDGTQLDLNVPEDKERYDNRKFRHDYEVEKQQTQAAQRAAEEERAASEKAARDRAEYEQTMKRADEYVQGRYAVRDQMIESVVAPLAEEDKIFGNMFRAYVKDHIDNHPDMKRIGEEATPHVLAADGRVPEYARAQEAIIRREINTLKDSFSRAILRLNRAEIAATTGQPKVLPGTKTVESYAQPQLDENVPLTKDDLLRQARQIDRQTAGVNRY